MGTRADFYVGRGEGAEWLGSVAFDGYPEGIGNHIPFPVITAEDRWRDEVTKMLSERRDGTLPRDGWPWPWDTSDTTDYAYAFDGGKVWASCFGSAWWPAIEEQTEDDRGKDAQFPNMAGRKQVTLGARSGVIFLRGPAAFTAEGPSDEQEGET